MIMTKLDSVIDAAEIMQKSGTIDFCIVVCDKTKIVYILAPDSLKEMAKGAKVGDVPKGLLFECMETKQPVKGIIPKSHFGFAGRIAACPVFDDKDEIIGACCTSTSLKNQEVLNDTAQTIAATTEEMAATIEELGVTAAKLSDELGKVKIGSEIVIDKIKNTDNILKFVNNVAANSNLLGINAAIEAARAGKQGRGFAVVADEIRKMAANSIQSVSEIKKMLHDIYDETASVGKTIERTFTLSEQQAKATDEIAVNMQALATTASDLEKIADVV
jgi:hypothetical protein